MINKFLLTPQWPAPPKIHAYTTTRQADYHQIPNLPQEPYWLKQVHGTKVLILDETIKENTADGSWTNQPGKVCVVRTADCLPVLLCDQQGTCVAALHAGWRGLAAGILEEGVHQLPAAPNDLLAWLGPAISAANYEVGEEVREVFLRRDPKAERAFHLSRPGHWFMDLYFLARQRLQSVGVNAIFGGEYCTYRDRDQFYSYRRDATTERLASVIWITPASSV